MIALLAPLTALAHEPGLSRAVVEDDALVLSVSRTDVDGDPAALLGPARATVDGVACTLGSPSVSSTDDDGVEVRAALTCPSGEKLEVEAGWLGLLPPGHRTVVERGGAPLGFVDAKNRTLSMDHGMSAFAAALLYLELGVEHILTGWDHLAFLAALLLVARSFKEAMGVATGFTVAHSITLSMAALGLVNVPGWLVEPAIAATILYVGLENLTRPPPMRRFVLTMVLGLIHGLGFAGLLGELGLPREHLVLALLSFNGGVEVGQFLVVLVVLPLLLALRRDERWRSHGVRWASVAVAASGAFWLCERIGG